MRDTKDFLLTYIRFGWNDEKVTNGPALKVSDTLILIVDKDDKLHRCLIEGKILSGGIFVDTPCAMDSEAEARYYLEKNEYIETEEGLRIPRCNIKYVTFQEKNQRIEQPYITVRGIRNWNIGDVLFSILPLFSVGFMALGLLVVAYFKWFK